MASTAPTTGATTGDEVTVLPVTALVAELGEGPVWDSEHNKLMWVDIVGKRVLEFDPEQKDKERSWDMPSRVGAVGLATPSTAPTAAGAAKSYVGRRPLIVALEDGMYGLDTDTGKLALVVTANSNPRLRFNDGKTDPAGRWWVGTMDLKESDGVGSLHCMEADNSVGVKVDGGITVSNGLAWTDTHMYYIDSPTRRVDSFTYDSKTGSISDRKTVVTFPEKDPEDDSKPFGIPDGMTIDSDGNLWVAVWSGGKVTQWDPSTGKLLRIVRIPARNVTCCAWGGAGLDELYVTTARVATDEKTLKANPDTGRVFVVRGLGCKGRAPYTRFAGDVVSVLKAYS